MRRLLIALVGIVAVAGRGEAAPAFVEVSSWQTNSGTTCTISIDVASGNSVAVGIAQLTAGSRTYTVSDGTNTYSQLAGASVSNTNGNKAEIWRAFAVTGGTLSIVVTINSGGITFHCQAIEFTEANQDDAQGEYGESTTFSTHPGGGGQISANLGASSFVYVVGVMNAAPGGTLAAGSDGSCSYTATSTADAQRFSQYGACSGAETGADGSWSHTGAARQAATVLASFTVSGGGGGGSTPCVIGGGIICGAEQ